MIKIGLTGSTGRMGKEILSLASQVVHQNVEFIAFYKNSLPTEDVPKHERIAKTTHLDELAQKSDIVVDFSSPEFTIEICKTLAKHKTPLMCGTTGLEESQIAELKKLSEITKVCWSMNTSLGINLIRKTVGNLAKQLPDAEVEILETHHNQKIDSPSGTAIMLGKEIAKSRGVEFESVAKINRSGKRNPSDIGYAVRRAGKIPGEHQVAFFWGDEMIEIKHTSFSRKIFASGAIDLAIKLYNIKEKSGFFDSSELL